MSLQDDFDLLLDFIGGDGEAEAALQRIDAALPRIDSDKRHSVCRACGHRHTCVAAPARPEASTDDCICGSYGQRDHTHACWLALVKRLARLVAEGTEAKSEPAGHTGQASAYQPCNHSRTVPYRGGKRCADCGAHKVGH